MKTIEQDILTVIDRWDERINSLIATREFQHKIIKNKISAEINAIRRNKRDLKIVLEKIKARSERDEY